MSTKLLEQTVSDLQRRVADLENKVGTKPREGWKRLVGATENDAYFGEAMKLGAEWRNKANKANW